MSNSSCCQRIFLGWDRPFLDSACKWLLSKADRSTHLDLSHISLLSTVGRAARHLIEKLVAQSEKEKIGLSPPNIVSISGLYETLLPNRSLVTKLDSELIFFSILKSYDLSKLEALFPNIKNFSAELKLFEKARFLSSTYQEFTKNGDSALDSIQTLLKSSLIPNEERWLALFDIFSLYQDKLVEFNFIDTQSALKLLESKSAPENSSIVLLACHDLTPILKRTISSGYASISSLIFAPESEENGFDEIGCIRAEYWSKRESKFDASSVKTVKSSKDQVYQLFDSLNQIEENILASQITIGALEPGLDRLLEISGSNLGLPVHLPNKTSLSCCEAAQLLTKSLQFKLSKKFSDLSSLLTLSSITNKLATKDKSLILVNNYREGNLQPHVSDLLPSADSDLVALLKSLEELLAPLSVQKGSLSAWIEASCTFLTSIYQNEIDANTESLIAKIKSLNAHRSEEILDAGLFHYLISSMLEENAAIEDISDNPSKFQGDSIDVVGWLELALDSAPYTFILSFNEGFVPANAGQSSFLPNQAKTLIGLEDNNYRLARDTYVLETLLASKKRLKIFAAKNSLEASPLLPSRLTLKGKAQQQASTIISYFSQNSDSKIEDFASSGPGFKSAYAQNLLPVKQSLPSPLKVSVTALGDYLNCPYLFYLKHILKLESAKPDARELSALQFGSLIHDIIATFGNSALSAETSADKIENYLLSLLQSRFEILYGKHPFAEVLVQYHQLVSRLKNFAVWQAGWRSEGWQIYKVELPFADPGYAIKTDSGPALLKGRIDRIDFNPKTSEYAVLDFKSGDSAATPSSAFSKTKGWLDVQLPAYLFYASEILELQNVKLALLPISASTEALTPKWADWDDSHFELAWEAIIQSLSGIINQEFWPPKITSDSAWDFESIYRAHL